MTGGEDDEFDQAGCHITMRVLIDRVRRCYRPHQSHQVHGLGPPRLPFVKLIDAAGFCRLRPCAFEILAQGLAMLGEGQMGRQSAGQ